MGKITSEEGINRAIGTANYNIENFQDKKARYEHLKTVINSEAIPNLDTAKKLIAKAKKELENDYDSDESRKKINELESCWDETDTMIKVLTKTIVPEISAKIYSLKIQIEDEQFNIKKYNNMLSE